jgi:polysaccharide pyruvyl transferase WcaK-like protein
VSMNISKQSDKVYIIIHGYFGFGNVGDEAILSVIIDEFKKLFKNVEFVVLSCNPSRTSKLHGVKAIRERLTSLSFWKIFIRSHILVFAGGGRYGYATWRRMSLLSLLARLLGKTVIFRAVGVYPYDWYGSPVISRKPEPFKGFTGLLVRLAVSRASLVSVRDKYSYIVLRLTGINRHVLIEKDLAFKLKLSDPSECRALATKYDIVEGKVLGINLRTLNHEINKKVIDHISKLIEDFISMGFNKVIFLPFGFGSFKDRFFDDDLLIFKRLKERVPNIAVIDKELNPRDVLCLFNYLDHVIVMRHHATVFALIANKPVTVLVYDTKTLEMIESLHEEIKKSIKVFLINHI